MDDLRGKKFVVDDKEYIIGHKIFGKGAYGRVYDGTIKGDPTPLAVKVIKLTQKIDDQKSEIKVLDYLSRQKIFCPYLIKFYEAVVVEEKYLLIFMEQASGHDLFEADEIIMKFNYFDIIEMFSQMALAVKYIHNHHIAHRDIKPPNFILTSNGTIKLIDFGMACSTRKSDKHIPLCIKRAMGTPDYLAPETITESDFELEPTDIYSLGMSFYLWYGIIY